MGEVGAQFRVRHAGDEGVVVGDVSFSSIGFSLLEFRVKAAKIELDGGRAAGGEGEVKEAGVDEAKTDFRGVGTDGDDPLACAWVAHQVVELGARDVGASG